MQRLFFTRHCIRNLNDMTPSVESHERYGLDQELRRSRCEKVILRFVCLYVLLCSHMFFASQSDAFINYDFLQNNGQKNLSIDYLPHIRRLFHTTNVRGFLECGCSYSTKYFLEHCQKVTSLDFYTSESKNKLFKECVSLFSYHKNWVSLLYNESRKDMSFMKACSYRKKTHKDYALIDSSYVKKLDLYFKKIIQGENEAGTPIDVAFVNPSMNLRGDIVQILLTNNVPVVIAHDTESAEANVPSTNLYGWDKVQSDSNYEKIYIPYKTGTTFWIKKDLPFVISSLTNYRNSVLEAKKTGEIQIQNLTTIADEMAIFDL